jgi:3-methyladenine DNA glycosylase AlkC
MRKLLAKLVFVPIFVFASSTAIAIVISGSNLSISEYPSHTCSAPSKPIESDSYSEQREVDQYNSEVNNYNSQIRLYRDCIREYVANEKNDIKKVREKITEAINEANSQ